MLFIYHFHKFLFFLPGVNWARAAIGGRRGKGAEQSGVQSEFHLLLGNRTSKPMAWGRVVRGSGYVCAIPEQFFSSCPSPAPPSATGNARSLHRNEKNS